MIGVVISSLQLDRLTVKTEKGYIAVALEQRNIPAVKKEFGVEYAKDIIDKEIELDFAAIKIFAVPEEKTPESKKSSGVQCTRFRTHA